MIIYKLLIETNVPITKGTVNGIFYYVSDGIKKYVSTGTHLFDENARFSFNNTSCHEDMTDIKMCSIYDLHLDFTYECNEYKYL